MDFFQLSFRPEDDEMFFVVSLQFDLKYQSCHKQVPY